MHMLYNSESFVVVRFDMPQQGGQDGALPVRGAYEIVDKAAGREIFIEGALAERFKQGVDAIVERGAPSEEVIDEYIAGFTELAQQPVVLH